MTDPEGIRKRVRGRLAEQRRLVRSLLEQRQQLQGSLFVRYGVCGKPGCACRQGARHGPYYVLSTRSGGRGRFSYLEARRVEEARSLVARSRAFRAGLRRLRAVNRDLVSLLRRYQASVSRRATRKLGLHVSLVPKGQV
jgi:Family of unknown function (DUF6788)